jgi:3-oxoacyl-[acyl-carrier protein] reductase
MILTDKKVIVTGGVKGLGRSIVDKLLSKGAVLSIFDIDIQGLNEIKQQKSDVSCFVCDVSDYQQVVSATAEYHDKFGVAEVLINNAGILYSAPLVRITASGIQKHDVDMWNKVISTDLSSVFYMTSCVVEKMITARKQGVIVNISSVSASGNAGQSAYSAAKAGVNALTATWAKELSLMGVRVVGLAPGFTETESTRQAVAEGTLKEIVNKVPLRRLGRPEEIAEGLISIVENDFFNGKVFELDGGLIV